jgi:hypothetical protein
MNKKDGLVARDQIPRPTAEDKLVRKLTRKWGANGQGKAAKKK